MSSLPPTLPPSTAAFDSAAAELDRPAAPAMALAGKSAGALPPAAPSTSPSRRAEAARQRLRTWRRGLLVGAASALLAWVGLRFGSLDDSAVLLWLPAGFVLGAILRWGPAMALAAVPGLLAAHLAADKSLVLSALCAAVEAAAPWLAAAWLQQRRFQPRLPGARDAQLLGAAVLGSACITGLGHGLLDLAATTRTGGLSASAMALLSSMGAALGGLLGSLPWLTLADGRKRRPPTINGLGGRLLLSAAAVLAGGAAMLAVAPISAAQTWLLFVPPMLLTCLAARHSLRWSSGALLALSLASLVLLAPGHGPFGARGDRGHALLLLWGYLGCCGVLVLIAHAGSGELRRVKHRWRLALEAADVGVADWDLATGRSHTSPRWQALLGASTPQTSSLPPQQAWLALVHPDDREREAADLRALQQPGRDSHRRDLRLHTAKGWNWFQVQVLVAERDDRGAPLRMIVTATDIGERRANEERQRLSARLFQHLHEGLLITDADLRVLDVNPTYSQIMGVSRHELLGTVPPLLAAARAGTPSGDAASPGAHGGMWASLRATGTWRGEVVDRRRNGDPCALQVTITAVLGPDGQPRYHVLVISDITEQHLQRQRLERQALFDELTRLPNRARLAQMLADAMAAADREGTLLAVCYLDLDHFKPVNDRHGHAAGDRLLVELAHRLRGALRSNAAWSDAAARLGGDEFVLLLRAGTLDEARLAVERVLRVISQPYAIQPGADPVTVTASVGATVYPLDRSDADTLLRHADHAMYGAKQSGRNGYSFFDPEHSRRTEERVMAIGRVQEALDNHELELYYQPKVDMRRGTVLGMEALLRWNHPEHGVISPAQFLPLIEHTGLSARVGDWVMGQALEQLARWQRQGLDLSVSVNVSARHLQEADFAQRLAEMLARHARPLGERLELEVLETAALADIDYTSALLERCRRLGVRFSLDDFGTGYSTLTYLKRLPVDVLKIDRSFVRNMLEDRQDLAIVEGVIGLARTFGCSVVAEGVELPAQARLLIDMGCDIGQGHGVASPMRAPEVLGWVKGYRGLFTAVPADAEGMPPR